MSTHEHLQQQEAANEAALRQRLLREIAGITPPPPAIPAPVTTTEAGEGNCHPFRDLNVTNLARQVDWLFLHRWLEGTNPCKKPQTQPASERPGTGAAQ